MPPREAAIVVVVNTIFIVIGVFLVAGLGWALIVGGALGVAAAAVLYDPKRRRQPKKPKTGDR